MTGDNLDGLAKQIERVRRFGTQRSRLRWIALGAVSIALGSIWSVMPDGSVRKQHVWYEKPTQTEPDSRSTRPVPIVLATVVFLASTASSPWTVPADWNSSSNTIETL